jgi:hypothetical protein
MLPRLYVALDDSLELLVGQKTPVEAVDRRGEAGDPHGQYHPSGTDHPLGFA